MISRLAIRGTEAVMMADNVGVSRGDKNDFGTNDKVGWTGPGPFFVLSYFATDLALLSLVLFTTEFVLTG